MTDFDSPSENIPPDLPPPFPWERPPRRARWVLVVAGLLLAGLVAVGMLIFGIQAFREMTINQGEVKATLSQFLKLLAVHKENEAYALFSVHARQTTSLEKLMDENNGRGFSLVDGYQGIDITRFEIEKGAAARADAPQGEYAEVTGWVTYDHKPACPFRATLEHEAGAWLLYGINIETQPDESS
jgi:hypothetical protein